MVRDYSAFLGGDAQIKRDPSALESLGWQPFFAQQLSMEDMENTPPVRVTEVHRTKLHVMGDGIDRDIPVGAPATVGDWLLLDTDFPGQSKVLKRKSLIKRLAAGHETREQLIAANVDTAFIVSSCNPDFSVPRMERYVALVREAEVIPVIVLTKADMCDDPSEYITKAQSISDEIEVIALNARGDDPTERLAPWVRAGQTVVFVGSSGVGKSTLTNSLSGQKIETAAIREDDARGRHTTTHRHLYFLKNGCSVLDTPGMRELQLADAEEGIADVFSDLHDLAGQCKFNDCKHLSEPGCAINKALKAGKIEPMRMERWRKLVQEEHFNSETIENRRKKNKDLAKLIKGVKKRSKK